MTRRPPHFLLSMPSEWPWCSDIQKLYGFDQNTHTPPSIFVCNEPRCPIGPATTTKAGRASVSDKMADIPTSLDQRSRPVLTSHICTQLEIMTDDACREAELSFCPTTDRPLSAETGISGSRVRTRRYRNRLQHRTGFWTGFIQTELKKEAAARRGSSFVPSEAELFDAHPELRKQKGSLLQSEHPCQLCDCLSRGLLGSALPTCTTPGSHNVMEIAPDQALYQATRRRYNINSFLQPTLLISIAAECPWRWTQARFPVQTPEFLRYLESNAADVFASFDNRHDGDIGLTPDVIGEVCSARVDAWMTGYFDGRSEGAQLSS